MAQIRNLKVDFVQGSERTAYAEWNAPKKVAKYNNKGEVVKSKGKTVRTTGCKDYDVRWEYLVGGRWYAGSDSTTAGGETELMRVTYSIPNNATQIRVKVKPNPTTHKKKVVKKQRKKKVTTYVDVNYWTGTYSGWAYLDVPVVVTPGEGGVTNIAIRQQPGSAKTVYATWTWSKHNETANYEIEWEYQVVTNGPWFSGSSTTTKLQNSTYDIPDLAEAVRISIKPVAEQSIWVADKVYSNPYSASNLTLEAPPSPTLTVKKLSLEATVKYSGPSSAQILFQLSKDGKDSGYIEKKASISTGTATQTFSLEAGHKYKVRCRALYANGGNASSWSEWSDFVSAAPAVPKNIGIKAISATMVELNWTGDSYATSYTVEWTNKKEYFDGGPTQTQADLLQPRAIIDVGDNGDTYFFRVKAINSASESGESGWSEIVSLATGKPPATPTTWSSTTVVNVGEKVYLYWMHNSLDNSSQQAAKLELTINGETSVIPITDNRPDDKKDEAYEYVFDTSDLSEGAVINWRVCTKGAYSTEPAYSDWSVMRTVKVYAPATIYFLFSEERKWYWDPFNFITDTIYTAKAIGEDFPSVITELPIFINAKAGPDSQTAVRFTITLIALDGYETESPDGTISWVKENDTVFEKVVYPSKSNALKNILIDAITPGDVNLENGVRYRLTCSVAMDSGLSASCSAEFEIGFDDDILTPDAEVTIDYDEYLAYITPFCLGDDGEYLDNLLFSVYRREYDGTFTELATDLDSYKRITVTDPHPSLDYARYRIVAKTLATGRIGYADLPPIEYGEKAIIIQWSQEWSDFINDEDTGEPSNDVITGSTLRLPYDIDTAENHSPDVELIEYVGRKRPVSYYGTQEGETATWNVDIPADDKETLYQLRRLKAFMGDCYVREPSGTGYWANVNVSFSQKHRDVVIPVTLSLSRVEGGA